MFRNYGKLIIGVVLGSIGGLLYFYAFGDNCATGSCLISSVWYKSMAYGALMGGLAANLYQPK
jgi:hypothetical protein